MIEPVIGFANDYTFVEYFKQHTTPNELSVSVVIPYYKRLNELEFCLKQLSKQTHPTKQIQIIIVDDGSCADTQALQLANQFKDTFYEVIYIHQKDEGFRAARARNLGVKAALFDYIALVDCDILLCDDSITQHLRATSVSPLVVSLGFRANNNLDEVSATSIDFSQIPPKEALDWRLKHLDSAKFSNEVWRIVSSGNVCVHKSLFDTHLFDERFNAWGGEDNEWGYRLWKDGFYFYPNLQAASYHMVAGGFQTDRNQGRLTTIPLLKQLCPRFDEQTMHSEGLVPLVSVFITNYNKGVYVREAICSALKLPFRKEIIVVDNGSSDGSYEIAQELAKQNSCIVLTQELSLGAFFAFEKALSLCQGEVLVQLDADDVFIDDTVCELINYVLQSPLGIAFANTQPMNADLSQQISIPWRWPRCSREDNVLCGMFVRNPRVFKKRDLMRSRKRHFVQAAIDYNIYAPIHLVSYGTLIDRIGLLYRKLENSLTSLSLQVQKDTTLQLLKYNLNDLENANAIDIVEVINGRSHICEKKTNISVYYRKHLQIPPNLWATCSDVKLLIDPFVFEIDQAQNQAYLNENLADLSNRLVCTQLTSRLQSGEDLNLTPKMSVLLGLVSLPKIVPPTTDNANT